jgi:hypothetical protein
VSAIKGSVVTVPLVGCVPLHHRMRVQVSAYFALHCKVRACPGDGAFHGRERHDR